jgi:5-methylcytosine-specific restriction endonuclease McrA
VVKGKEVKAVAHYGRNIPAATRSAVMETYLECVVTGCHETKRLEIDHVIPLPEGPTSYENLVRICAHHHYLKTHRGYLLGPRKEGKARLEPPKGARSRASPG